MRAEIRKKNLHDVFLIKRRKVIQLRDYNKSKNDIEKLEKFHDEYFEDLMN